MAGAIFKAFNAYKSDVEGVEIKIEAEKSKSKRPKEDIPVMNNAGGKPAKSLVIYRVQIASSTNKVETKSYNFKGISDVFEYNQNGIFRYYTGKSSNIGDASKVQAMAREKGYGDAFIVPFYNGEKISMGKARELSEK